MAKVTVNLEFDRLKASLMQASERGLDRGAGIVQAEAKSILNRPGQFKTLAKRAKKDPALAAFLKAEGLVDPPGGSPRKRTGALARSVMTERNAPNKRKVGPAFGLKYAAIHEFGGKIRTRFATITMPMRPYMRPALHRSSAAIASAYSDSIRSALAAFRPSKVKP